MQSLAFTGAGFAKQEGGEVMYKVVIVDDEPIIVEGLSKSFPWEQCGCRVVATAESGEEGKSVVMEHNPDILITDISMPGIDGLKLIAGVKSEHPDLEISILTGYREFEYAREAIRLGVTRLLLKPSKMDEIKEAVDVMVENLKKKGIGGGSGQSIYSKGQEGILSEESGGCEAASEIIIDSEAGSFIVNNALSFIEKNYMNKLKLADVAEQVYVSQWHLSKLMNRYTGQSFSDILNNARIENAKELLRNPALRIGDVAEMVGFMDMAHFSRVFKKLTGVSANEYRNTLREAR